MRKKADEFTDPPLVTVVATPTGVPLVLLRLETSGVGPPTGQAAATFSAAEATACNTRLAYIAAVFVYVAITTFALALGMPDKLRHLPTYAQVILLYLLQWPPLLILVWFIGVSVTTRLAILGGYLLLGLLVVPIAPSFSAVATVASMFSQLLVLPITTALLLLLARPLRPWLLGVVAILLFLVAMIVTYAIPMRWLFGPSKIDLTLGKDWHWMVPATVMLLIVAVVFVGWILRYRSWRWPLAWLAFFIAAGLLVNWLLPDSKIGLILLAVPPYVVQIFVVWLFFKLFVRLQERQFLL